MEKNEGSGMSGGLNGNVRSGDMNQHGDGHREGHGDRETRHTWENRGGGMRGGLGETGGNAHMGRSGGDASHKAKKMKIYKRMCEKAIDRMSALFGQSVEPHEMTKALLMAVKKGSPEEVVSAIEIFSDYRWAVNEKKELAEEFDAEDED